MTLQLTDIGVNLLDDMFLGIYNNKRYHQPDIHNVLDRAQKNGVVNLILTIGSIEDLERLENNIHLYNRENLYYTVGIHPTRCMEFLSDKFSSPNQLLEKLILFAQKFKEKVVAVGEFGLDYDRTQYCPVDIQKQFFDFQFELAEKLKLPLFLHLRNAAQDFIDIIKKNRHRFSQGVVHSFDGTKDELLSLLDLGLYIGINGCSLKTEQNLEVVKLIPVSSLLIETDAPWCQIRPNHASGKLFKTKFPEKPKEKWQSDIMVKGRNEPSNLIQIIEVISHIRNEPIETLSTQIYSNSVQLFFNNSPPIITKNSFIIPKKNTETPTNPTSSSCVPLIWPYGGDNVKVGGTFNNWELVPMTIRSGYYYIMPLRLLPGKYLYKFQVDGIWRYDIKQPFETDDCGNINNILQI